jgi:hypothetical protein
MQGKTLGRTKQEKRETNGIYLLFLKISSLSLSSFLYNIFSGTIISLVGVVIVEIWLQRGKL